MKYTVAHWEDVSKVWKVLTVGLSIRPLDEGAQPGPQKAIKMRIFIFFYFFKKAIGSGLGRIFQAL